MINTIRAICDREHPVAAVRQFATLAAERLAGRLNARLFGWTGCVPLGSRIAGTRHISVGPGFFARGPVWIEAIAEYEGEAYHPRIEIGRNFRCSDRLHVTSTQEVVIGDDCLFGSGVLVSDNSHGEYSGRSRVDDHPATRPLVSKGPVKIGERCWLGDNVVVLSGVEIGSGSVVAANSVVTRSIPSNSVAAGAPARVLRYFDQSSGRWTSSYEHQPT